MSEMKSNILIDSTLSWDSTQYENWINSLKRNDTCFVQSLVEGRHESLGAYFWRYRHARIIWGRIGTIAVPSRWSLRDLNSVPSSLE